jgi:hypothetical protein
VATLAAYRQDLNNGVPATGAVYSGNPCIYGVFDANTNKYIIAMEEINRYDNGGADCAYNGGSIDVPVYEPIHLYPDNAQCAALGSLTLFETDNAASPTILYYAFSGGVPVVGNDLWFFYFPTGTSYQVNNSGVIINSYSC